MDKREDNKSTYQCTRFGREMKISPKSNAMINAKGYKVEFFTETVEVSIGIGSDHTASLIMDKEAWEAFNSGEDIIIDTVKDFVNKFVK